MRTTRIILPILAICMALFTSCNKNNEEPQVQKEIFSGYAQKGPFVNGTSVTISELDTHLNQTGKTYLTTIIDNSGSFEHKNIELVSGYVELKVDGYYFNEIMGQSAEAPLTLYALTDIEDINSGNVNVLTHLEKLRVDYLVKQENLSFPAAKSQAQREVLALFGFEPEEVSSEALDLTNNAALLAISCILQGYLAVGDMMELMADIITDIKPDGKLDNIALGTKLMNNAYSISTSLTEIRNNLTAKYAELGANVTIPDFESYIDSFLHSDLYPQTLSITYPEKGEFGDNILSDHVISVMTKRSPPGDYSMTADVPKGSSLKIVMTGAYHASWGVQTSPSLYYNWSGKTISYDPETHTTVAEYTVKESGKPCDIALFASDPFDMDGQTLITDQSCFILEYYENGATTPTKTKRIQVISSF